jgi:hypothetical protein
LFLDVNDPDDPDEFDPQNPQDSDEADEFVPGSRLSGLSEAPTEVQPIQNYVTVIAAFVDDGGKIVPLPGAADVTFDLTNVSAFPGIAMNRGTGTEPDFALSVGPEDPVGFGVDGTARVNLLVYDYGGFATVTA